MENSIAWTNEKRKLSQLIPWKRNPRQIKGAEVTRLQESLVEFGQVEPTAIGPDNEVYNGHQRLKSWAAKFGDIEIDVRVSSRALTEKEREKLTVYLHKGAAGEWNFDTLANEFELDDLLEWGFDKKELDLDLWAGEPDEDPGAQIDRAEELREKWGVELGQMWKLGEHRIICGDCTDRAVVERVMEGERADAIITDPPYGVGDLMQGGSWATKEDIEFSKMREWDKDTYQSFFDLIVSFEIPSIVWGGNYFNTPPSRCWLVWNKPEFPSTSSAELAWTNIDHNTKRFEHNRTHQNEDKKHPTQKPTPLIVWCMSFVEKANIIFDPFSGSGTTLIACEQLNRKCRAIEISPAYVAVAIDRWATMTGGTPELIDS